MIRSLRYSLFVLLTVSTVSLASAQDVGIKFENNLSWSAMLAKAKAEDKYIFMDCSATWCGPCKYMAQKVFTQKAVADYFNEHFINVAVQMDRTAKDPEEIKSWYADADSIGSKYTIGAYPTFLFFSPDGEAVDRITGTFEADEFLAKATNAQNPEKQYYTIINNCKDHLHDSLFLRSALTKAIASFDNQSAEKIAEFYLASIKNSFSIDNIDVLKQVKMSVSGDLFYFFLTNTKKIDTVIGRKEGVENLLCDRIRDEKIKPLFENQNAVVDFNEVLHNLQNKYPELSETLPTWVETGFHHYIKNNLNQFAAYKNDFREPDWKAMSQFAIIHYPGYNCKRIIDEMKPEYYRSKKMWPQFEKSSLAILDRYGASMNAYDINNLVWDNLFMYSTDPKALRTALYWSKRSVDMWPADGDCKDTYANLLYKLGDRQKALEWEKTAFEQSSNSEAIRSNYEKMKKGEKTW